MTWRKSWTSASINYHFLSTQYCCHTVHEMSKMPFKWNPLIHQELLSSVSVSSPPVSSSSVSDSLIDSIVLKPRKLLWTIWKKVHKNKWQEFSHSNCWDFDNYFGFQNTYSCWVQNKTQKNGTMSRCRLSDLFRRNLQKLGNTRVKYPINKHNLQ